MLSAHAQSFTFFGLYCISLIQTWSSSYATDPHTDTHHRQDQPQDAGLCPTLVVEDGEHSGAHHDADHEAAEHHPKWG